MKKNILILLLVMTAPAVYAGSDIPTFDAYDKEAVAMEKEATDEWKRDARANNPNFDALPKNEQDKLIIKEGLAAIERTRPDVEAYRDYAEKHGTQQEKEEARTAIANLERVQQSIRSGAMGADFDRAAADLDKQMRKDFEAEKAATSAQPELSKPAPTASAAELAKQRADVQSEIRDLEKKRAADPMVKAGYTSASTEHDEKLFAARERLADIDTRTAQEDQKTSLDKDIADLKRQQSAERVSGFTSNNTDSALADAEEKRAALEPRPVVAPAQDKPTPSVAVASEDTKPVAEVRPVVTSSVTTEIKKPTTKISGVDFDRLDAEDKEATKKTGYFRNIMNERKDAAQAKVDVQKVGLDNEIKTLTDARQKVADANGRDVNDPTLKTQYDDKLSAALDKREVLDAPKTTLLQRAKQAVSQKIAAYQLKRIQADTAKLQKAAARPKQADSGSQSYYNNKIRDNDARAAALAQKAKAATAPKASVTRRPTQTTATKR